MILEGWLRLAHGEMIRGRYRTFIASVLLVAFADVLLWRIGGRTSVHPSALVAASGWGDLSGYLFGKVLEVLFPLAGLIPVAIWGQSLVNRRRALSAAWSVSTSMLSVVRLVSWLLLMAGWLAEVSLGSVVMGKPVVPWADMLLVLPVALWSAGLAYLIAELSRHPASAVVLVTLLAVLAAMVSQVYHPLHPPWWLPVAASAYPVSAALWVNRVLWLVAGMLCWTLGGAVEAWNRKRGEDV